MPQLTGFLTGSLQNDLFTGSLNVVDLSADTTEVGIAEATISALGGDDTIESIVTLEPGVGELTLDATGILETTIDAGAGNDTVIGRGFAAEFFDGFGPRGPRFSGKGLGVGLAASTVNGRSGNDVLTFIGEGEGSNFLASKEGVTRFANSTGVLDSTVNGGAGADIITVEGEIGALRSTILGGGQQDTISISATGAVNTTVAAEQSNINAGADADTLTVAATGLGSVSTLRSTQVKGGRGDDTIVITNDATSVVDRQLTSSTAIAAEQGSAVRGGQGNDSITIRGNAAATGGASAVGLSGSSAFGGAGNDAITISATAGGIGVPFSYAALDAVVSGGRGDDVIQFDAFGSGSGVTVAAVRDSNVRGGAGNDTLSFKISGTTINATGSAGIVGSTVRGDDGNDRFTVEVEPFEAANDDGQPEYDIVDALIFGGAGDDTFDVGIGDSTLDGGTGVDLAIIDFFDAETMEVSAIANGVQIVGSQTRSGIEGSWTQNITNTESFQVGDAVYTAEGLISTFSV